ncbi:MAG: hypothetical protein B193_0946 [Solidesulfovibrio magneticus str. Maddingley MBC34]|uniref:Pentapeptide repeat-containing protein n=1 Tax=Solidesulfovibrio magneticus str. Maddingley MBC34 TaxID=1206767 RepID=K6HCW8_9BACT|nr:MAG: hypothetical protein B193_0946 [Solidesulfovibrio magneticus str. Maddingley MBC34]
MTCHLCSESQLQENTHIAWTDHDGNEYCILHAPSEHKTIGQKDFNDLIFHIIKKAADNDQWCDLSKTIFPWEIKFSNRSIGHKTPVLDFSEATFKSDLYFVDLSTKNRLIISNATFEQNLVFHGVDIEDWSDFAHIACDGEVRFQHCKTIDTASFNSATFRKTVVFRNVNFKNETDFSLATFKGSVTIESTRFLNESRFGQTKFEKQVTIDDSTFDKTEFIGTNFIGRASFRDLYFFGDTTFLCARFKEKSIFYNCKTSKYKLSFDEIKIAADKNITFSRMDMSNSTFLFTNVDKIRFHNVTWQLSPDGARHVSPIESNLQGNHDKNFRDISEEVLQDTINFYRQMKKKARDTFDDEEASRWHYSEKELRLYKLRNSNNLSFQRIILETYRTISRYGEDPLQAAEVLFYLALLLLASLALGGLYALGEPPFDITASRVAKGLRAFAQYALFMKPDWSPPAFFDFIAILLSRLLIPIQAAIFAFALRNKLHR